MSRIYKPSLPAVMPWPDATSPVFWAVAALNHDATFEAMGVFVKQAYNKRSSCFTMRMALISAEVLIEERRDRAFEMARNAGCLPFAWRGSRALVQALPASLQGGVA